MVLVVVVLLKAPAPVPMLQVTPALAGSLLTVAVNACVPLPPRLTEVVLRLTEIGFSVIVADADFVVSVLLVAVNVTVEPAAINAGAV